MFQGKVSRTSHDGGLLIEYTGSSPALNTVMVNTRGDYVGKVKGVIGNLKQSYVHLHNLERSVNPETLIGEKITIRPARERREQRNRKNGHSQTRNNSRERNTTYERRSGRQMRSNHQERRTHWKDERRGKHNNRNAKNHNDNDWVCVKCKNVNFSFRKECNKCGLPKKDELPKKRIERKTHSGPRTRHQRDQRLTRTQQLDKGTRTQQLDKGTWRCSCGSRNFQSNKVCMMCKKSRPQDSRNRFNS